MTEYQAVPEEIARALRGDEHVVWSGRPVRSARWDLSDTAMAGMFGFVAAFSTFWQIQAYHTPLLFRLLGLAVPAVFVVVTVRYFVGKRWAGRHYVVTNRRFLTATRAGVSSVALADLAPPHLRHKSPDGVGTIVFGRFRPLAEFRAALPNTGGEAPAPTLVQVPDAEHVLSLLLAALRDPR